jgi:hypothetical protein
MSQRETLNELAAQTIAIWGQGGSLTLAAAILARLDFSQALSEVEDEGFELQPNFFTAVADELREHHFDKAT